MSNGEVKLDWMYIPPERLDLSNRVRASKF